MFTIARTSARTLLVAAGAAGFVALGSGTAGADTLGGLTDGLPLGDLGGQVPASLTEGVATPLGELVKVQPGEVSAQPDVRRQAAPEQLLAPVAGSGLSTDTPVETGEDNAANLGPLELVGGTLPLSHAEPVASSPLSGVLGGTDLLGGLLGQTGGTLPLSHPESPVPLENTTEEVGDGLHRVGSSVERGVHEAGGDLSGLDATLPTPGEPLPLTAPESPVVPVNSHNTDLTGGTADVVSDLVLSDDVTLPMSASSLPEPLGDAPVDLLPVPEDALPVGGSVVGPVSEAADDAIRTTQLNPGGDFVGNDMVGVDGMPDLGQPDVDTGRVESALAEGLV